MIFLLQYDAKNVLYCLKTQCLIGFHPIENDLINFAEDCVLESINELKGVDGEGGGGKEEQ